MLIPIKGTIITCEKYTGKSTKNNKDWTRFDIVLKPFGPDSVYILLTGFDSEKKSLPTLNRNDTIEIVGRLSARKWKDKWYNQVVIEEVSIYTPTQEEMNTQDSSKMEPEIVEYKEDNTTKEISNLDLPF